MDASCQKRRAKLNAPYLVHHFAKEETYKFGGVSKCKCYGEPSQMDVDCQKRRVMQPIAWFNSQIMPLLLNVMVIAECSWWFIEGTNNIIGKAIIYTKERGWFIYNPYGSTL